MLHALKVYWCCKTSFSFRKRFNRKLRKQIRIEWSWSSSLTWARLQLNDSFEAYDYSLWKQVWCSIKHILRKNQPDSMSSLTIKPYYNIPQAILQTYLKFHHHRLFKCYKLKLYFNLHRKSNTKELTKKTFLRWGLSIVFNQPMPFPKFCNRFLFSYRPKYWSFIFCLPFWPSSQKSRQLFASKSIEALETFFV